MVARGLNRLEREIRVRRIVEFWFLRKSRGRRAPAKKNCGGGEITVEQREKEARKCLESGAGAAGQGKVLETEPRA